MKSVSIKTSGILVITLFYVSYMLFPLFSDLLQIPLGIPNIIVFVGIVLFSLKSFLHKDTLWVAIYLLILLSYALLGKQLPAMGIGDYESKRIVLIEASGILPSIALASAILYLNKPSIYKTITITSLFLLIASFTYLIPIIVSEPELLRQSDIKGEFHVFGTPAYSLTNAYMLMVPALMYGIRTSKKWLLLFIIITTVLLCVVVYLSYVSTAIFLSAIAIVLAFLYNNNNEKKIITMIVICIVLLFLYVSGIFEAVLDGLVSLFSGTAVQRKMEDLRNIFLHTNTGGGSLSTRQNLHEISWIAFKNDLLFGSLPVGGHSSILDRLGGLGLFGFIPYVLIFVYYYKRISLVLIDKECRFFWTLSNIITFVLLFEKGIFGAEGWFIYLVIIPVFLKAFNKKRQTV